MSLDAFLPACGHTFTGKACLTCALTGGLEQTGRAIGAALVTPGQRDELLKVRWGSREVTLRSTDGGSVYVGATGQEGLILVVRMGTDGRCIARIEDRAMNNSWACPVPKHSPQIAVASLHREIKRLCNAGGLR